MENVAETLANEIIRVTKLRERYASLSRLPQVNVGPILYLIDHSLKTATTCLGSDDAIESIAALENLKSFTE